MAHELNNPLTIIKGLVRAVKKDLSNDIIQKDFASEKLKKIDSHIDRTAEVIEMLQRLSSSEKKEPWQEFMILPMLEIVKKMLIEEFPNCREDFVISVSDPNLMLKGMKKEIELVFYQLVKNALSYRESHDKEDLHSKVQVKVESDIDKDELIFSVIDFGKGISAENSQNLFKPNFKLNSGGVGVGLGLALAWRGVILHSGSIQLTSTSKPTIFKIILPKSP